MEGVLTLLGFGLLAFMGFVVYFIFKILQFVIQATNLYKKMVERQDMMIKLLIDMRDNTKQFDISSTVDDKDDDFTEPQLEPEKCMCSICETEVSVEDKLCPNCGADLTADCICGECGADVSDTDKFCPQCKAEISESEDYVCSDCGGDVSPEDKQCPKCGKSLNE